MLYEPKASPWPARGGPKGPEVIYLYGTISRMHQICSINVRVGYFLFF